ncbi:DUF342 domain-containing protein [Catenovulum sediminis]|uniref:FapA family protein n=1 Tax=Catenovulum sediminis TaxID=1740262 RepID=A0ABV1RJB5_9ALTE
MAELKFNLDEHSGELTAVVTISQDSQALKDSWLKSQLATSDYANLFVIDKSVTDFVAMANDKIIQKQFSQPVELVVAEVRDAKINVTVANDSMSAKAEIIGPYGGAYLTPNKIIKALTQKGVSMGVDQDAVKNLAELAANAEPGEITTQVIAHGQQPIKGDDSWFEALSKNARERVLQPQEAENGKVDMRDLGELISVKVGDAIMRRHPPTKGKSGFNVLGDALLATPGEWLEFEAGSGCVVSPTDKNLLVAEMAGLPYLSEQGARIDNVLELKGVDVSTGHIDFEGGVIVNGDVAEGMRLKAKGDVTIAGFVENARLEVDGDVTVLKGIIGRKVTDEVVTQETEFSCNVQATGNVCAKYIQYAKVTCGKQLSFQAQLSHAFVKADSVVGGVENTPAGKIIGGLFQLNRFLSCATLGAPASTSTHIHLCCDLEKEQQKKAAIVQLKKHKKIVLEDLKAAWEHLKDDEACPERTKLVEETIKKYKHHDKEFKKVQQACLVLEKRISGAIESCYVYAAKNMYSQIHIQLGDLKTVTKEDRNNCRVSVKDNQFVRG